MRRNKARNGLLSGATKNKLHETGTSHSIINDKVVNNISVPHFAFIARSTFLSEDLLDLLPEEKKIMQRQHAVISIEMPVIYF